MRQIVYLLIAIFQSVLTASINDQSVRHIVTELEYNEIKSAVKENPRLLKDENIRGLLECKGNNLCAFKRKPTPLLLECISYRQRAHSIRNAALKNDKRAVKEMINAGVDPKWLDYPLKRALRLGLEDEAHWIRALLPQEMQNISVVNLDPEIQTNHPKILMLVCKEGITEGVLKFIELGADVNWSNEDGWSVLMEAASQGNIEMVEALIEAGADVNAVDKEDTAAMRGRLYVVQALFEAGAEEEGLKGERGFYALSESVFEEGTIVTESLIEAGVDVNSGTDDVDSALFKAASVGALEVLNVLIDAGVDVNAQLTGYLWTPLMHATRAKNLEIVKALIKAGADVNLIDAEGKTALDLSEPFSSISAELIRAGGKSAELVRAENAESKRTSNRSWWRRLFSSK